MLRSTTPPPRRQRGATLIFTAFFLVVLVLTLGLAIEIGRLYAAQTELQSVANRAALNAVRAVSGCRVGSSLDPAALVETTIDRNSTGGTDITATGRPTLGNLVSPERLQEFTVEFTDVDPAEANAVRVTLKRPAPDPLIAFFTGGGKLTATAAAAQTPVGAIRVGSRLVNLNTAQSKLLNAVLGQMLGTNLNLSVAGYGDLAQLDLTLLNLAKASVAAANVNELLSLGLKPGELLQLAAKAASPGMGGQVLDAIGDGMNQSFEVTLGNLLGIEAGVAGVVAEVPINALNLVSALAMTSANHRNEVIELGSDLLDGVLGTVSALPLVDISLEIELGIVEPPQPSGVGRPGFDDPHAGQFTGAGGSTNRGARTWASTSQVHLNIDAHVSLQVPNVLSLELRLPLYIHVGAAHAILADIDCADADTGLHHARVIVQPSILKVGIGEFDNIFDPHPQMMTNGQLLSLELVGVDLLTLALPSDGIQVSADSGAVRKRLRGPFVPQIEHPRDANSFTVSSEVGASVGNLLGGVINELTEYVFDHAQASFSGILGTLLGGLLDLLDTLGVDEILGIVGKVLQGLLTGLDAILTPLLNALGVSVGGAKVTVTAVIGDRPTLICTSAAACEAISVE